MATATAPQVEVAGARVLVVEDDPDWALLVREFLRETGPMTFESLSVESVAGARRELLERPVDCLLLDLSLPDASGLEALVELQSVVPEVPVVVLSGLDDESLAIAAVRGGAQDYLAKSKADPELLTRAIQYAIERKRSEVELARRALHDSLTGLPNRAFFMDRLELALSRSARRGLRVAVLFLDLDGFKRVNDRYGHAMGDAVLAAVAGRLHASVRPSDTLARFGGDEFVLLCEDLAGAEDAVALADRLREKMTAPFELGGRPVEVGLSVGIVFARGGGGVTAEGLIRDADRMMYRSKRHATPYELMEGRGD